MLLFMTLTHRLTAMTNMASMLIAHSAVHGRDASARSLHSHPGKGSGAIINNVSCSPRNQRLIDGTTDVQCDEVCVCCHRVLKRVGDYLRHAEKYQDAAISSLTIHGNMHQKTRLTYIDQMCKELRDRADEELKSTEKKRRSEHIGVTRKRAIDMESYDLQTSAAQKPRFENTGDMLTNHTEFQRLNGICATHTS